MKRDMEKIILKSSQFKQYVIINGYKNKEEQLIVNLPNYTYGILIISENKAFLFKNGNKHFAHLNLISTHQELITLHDMLSLIKGKKIISDKYWQHMMPSIKLIANDDTKGLLRIKKLVNTNNGEFSI